MAIKLNLLPPEKAVSGPLGKIVKSIRMLNVILLSAFIIFALGLGAFFVFTSIQLNSVNNSSNNLKAQISTLETSEQAMVLLKDRIGKIKSAQNVAGAKTNVANLGPFLSQVGPSSSLQELDVDSQKIDLSVIFRTNSDMTSFFKALLASTLFKSVTLSTFGYNPASGYLTTFHLL